MNILVLIGSYYKTNYPKSADNKIKNVKHNVFHFDENVLSIDRK